MLTRWVVTTLNHSYRVKIVPSRIVQCPPTVVSVSKTMLLALSDSVVEVHVMYAQMQLLLNPTVNLQPDLFLLEAQQTQQVGVWCPTQFFSTVSVERIMGWLV